jgi:uncharacterized delta-60 repeat protein
MSLLSLFSRRPRRTSSLPAARPSVRPRIEILEDRHLLSAGALDPTFHPSGTPPGTATNSAQSNDYTVLVQPSGKIVLAGWSIDANGNHVMSVSCFNPDGSLDTTFGSGGTAMSSYKRSTYARTAFAAALYNPTGAAGDEKILLVGQGTSNNQGAFALERYNANGTPDTSFGNGGLVVTTFKQGTTGASGVVVEPNGQIVVAGDNASGFELARYNPNGSLDTTFGSGGSVYTPVSNGTYAAIHCLAQEANGDLIVAGQTGAGQSQWLLAAYTPKGTLDTSFGNGGLVSNSSFTQSEAVTIYPSTDPTGNAGKIMVVGWGGGPGSQPPSAFDLARYNPNGTLDTTFGTGGMVTTVITANDSEAWAVAIQPDGKIVAGGDAYDGSANHFALIRYNPEGSLDSTFGAGGIVTTSIGGASSRLYGLALQPNGEIVAAGCINGSSQIAAVARYLSSPQITSFTANPNPVVAGSSVTLTASNITSGGGTDTQVAFYLDSNGDGILEPGTDTLLGDGTLSNSVWTFSFSISALGLTAGTYKLFAEAENSYGVFGDPLATTLQVM